MNMIWLLIIFHGHMVCFRYEVISVQNLRHNIGEGSISLREQAVYMGGYLAVIYLHRQNWPSLSGAYIRQL